MSMFNACLAKNVTAVQHALFKASVTLKCLVSFATQSEKVKTVAEYPTETPHTVT